MAISIEEKKPSMLRGGGHRVLSSLPLSRRFLNTRHQKKKNNNNIFFRAIRSIKTAARVERDNGSSFFFCRSEKNKIVFLRFEGAKQEENHQMQEMR